MMKISSIKWHKEYLNINTKNSQINTIKLNLFERIGRNVFGFYKNTHSKNILNFSISHPNNIPEKLISKIKILYNKLFNQEFPFNRQEQISYKEKDKGSNTECEDVIDVNHALANENQASNIEIDAAAVSCDNEFIDMAFMERDVIIQKGKDAGLDWCTCTNCDSNFRREVENSIVEKVLQTLPLNTVDSHKILSIGSGNLLQDLVLINELIKKGYKNFTLDLIDPLLNNDKVTILKNFFTDHFNIQININVIDNIGNSNNKNYHICYAIDFDAATYNVETWDTLLAGITNLSENAVFHIDSKNFFNYTFNSNEIPCEINNVPFNMVLLSQQINQEMMFISLAINIIKNILSGKNNIKIEFLVYEGNIRLFKMQVKFLDEFLKKFKTAFENHLKIEVVKKNNISEISEKINLFHILRKKVNPEEPLTELIDYYKSILNTTDLLEISGVYDQISHENFFKNLSTSLNKSVRFYVGEYKDKIFKPESVNL